MNEGNAMVCRLIAERYGFENQFGQTAEELCELITALHKYKRSPCSDNLCNVAEEIADVFIMIYQIQYLLNIEDSDIQERISYKLNRQLKRLNTGTE